MAAVAKARIRDRIVRRREILLAAGRVFIKKGFRLATMEEIAAAADLGVGTLYHYFKSKEHLVASLLADATELLSERIQAAAAKPLPPSLGLLAINRAYADYYSEYPEFFRIQMFFPHDENLSGEFAKERAKIERLARQNFEILAGKIREGQKIGMYRADVDPMTAATTLWASYNGIFLAATNPPLLELAGVSVEKLLATAAFIHFAGIGGEFAVEPIVPEEVGKSHSPVALADLQEAVRAAPWVTPSMIFAGMRMTFQPEKARGVREVYEHRVGGKRGGVWTVTVDDGSIAVAQGPAARPSVVFEIADDEFIELVTGQIEATELLMRGQLCITGDLQKAALFRTFFLPSSDSAPKA